MVKAKTPDQGIEKFLAGAGIGHVSLLADKTEIILLPHWII